MVDECPMTEDCPGYDRDLRMCLIRPGDCEFLSTAVGLDLLDGDFRGPPVRRARVVPAPGAE